MTVAPAGRRLQRMTSVAIRAVAVAVVLVCAATASAQSLADVARQEAERRKAVTSPGKVYTNDALRPEPAQPGTAPPAQTTPLAAVAQPATPSAPSAGAPAPPKPAAPEPTAPEPAAGAVRNTEADWRARIAAARDGLSRARIFAEALQTRINVLSADYANRDDPAQREVVAADRQRALAELDRVKQEIEQHQKAMTIIRDEARRAGVPAGWVR